MFNVGGLELLVIFVLALLVLGPEKLPEAARQFGKATGTLRQMAQGFQREMEAVKNELTESEARARGAVLAAANPAPDSGDSPADAVDTPADAVDTPADAVDTPADAVDTPADAVDAPADAVDAPADPFTKMKQPSFDASAQPDRTVKELSANGVTDLSAGPDPIESTESDGSAA